MKKNKNIISIIFSLCMLLVFSFAAVGYAQDSQVDRAEVPLTDPSKPALVKASLITGSIMVTGYNGKTVIVEAKIVYREPEEEDEEEEAEEIKKAAKKKEKTKGMIRIRNTSAGLSIEEENNVVVVKARSYMHMVILSIKVPFKTSLKLKTVNGGEIVVDKVDGDLDVGNVNGSLTLKNVSGTVVAHTTNGEVKVSFDRVSLDKPMSFATFNGDVDVTFPANAKFNLKMKSDQGEIYSDFKLAMKTPPPQPVKKSKEKEKGKFRVKFDKSVYGLLNGGGEEVQFKTFNGDIYIRKKK